MDYGIEPFDGATAAEDDLRAQFALVTADGAERFPGFPQPDFASFAAHARRPSVLGPRRGWAARGQDGTLAGTASVTYPERENTACALARVNVAAAHRRRGVGTVLLRRLVADAGAQGRGRLVDEQVLVGSAGEGWARAAGFTEVLRNCWQMLDVQRTDQERWRVPAPAGFRIERWTGAAPEPLVAAFAAARNAITDAPVGGSGYVAPLWTVERVRQGEARARAAGEQLWYAVAVHEASGEVAALTGMVLDPHRTELCWQRDTAVVRAHRGRGLGLVVKAAMMRALVAAHPGLGRVVTNTAAENVAMRRVNERIGYLRYADFGMYEADVAAVAARLAAGGLPGPRRAAEAAAEPVSEPAESGAAALESAALKAAWPEAA